MSGPVCVRIEVVAPIEHGAEVAMISAFQQIVSEFIKMDGTPVKCTAAETMRAVDWLHAKFGSRP